MPLYSDTSFPIMLYSVLKINKPKRHILLPYFYAGPTWKSNKTIIFVTTGTVENSL
jgi:hypothetical protein